MVNEWEKEVSTRISQEEMFFFQIIYLKQFSWSWALLNLINLIGGLNPLKIQRENNKLPSKKSSEPKKLDGIEFFHFKFNQIVVKMFHEIRSNFNS